MGEVHLVDHPLVAHKLTLLRRKDASTHSFRQLLHEISALMAYEVLRDIPTQDFEVETPLETTVGKVIDGKKLVFVSILRAGTGILDGMLAYVPHLQAHAHRALIAPDQRAPAVHEFAQRARARARVARR